MRDRRAFILGGVGASMAPRLVKGVTVRRIGVMHRRIFILGISAMGMAPPLARAQPSAERRRIAVLSAGSVETSAHFRQAFRDGLAGSGWIDSHNVVIEWRYAGGRYERLPDLVSELLNLAPELIVAANNIVLEALLNRTALPIVMVNVLDPVGRGYVASLARPGGHVTGLTWDADPRMAEKYLELLREVVPRLSIVGGLIDPYPGIEPYRRAFEGAATKAGVRIHNVVLRHPPDFAKAFAEMSLTRVQAVRIYGSPITFSNVAQIARLAAEHRLPTIHVGREYVFAGGLMSYGADQADVYRRAAAYVDRLLRGARPADLPIERPQKFDLVVNLRTARALGLTIPPSLLLRADQLTE